MKNLCLVFTLFCSTQKAFTQIVTLENIARYDGHKVTICENIQGTYLSIKAKKTDFLCFGQPYPNETFKVVIFEEALEQFSYNPTEYLKNKRVCITGEVVLYKVRPEMIITDEQQIKIE
jgi:hypothetical protein